MEESWASYSSGEAIVLARRHKRRQAGLRTALFLSTACCSTSLLAQTSPGSTTSGTTSVNYRPYGEPGPDTVTYTVRDSQGATSNGQLQITVVTSGCGPLYTTAPPPGPDI